MTVTVNFATVTGVAVTVYLSQNDIARQLQVDRTAVSKWRARHPDFPAPDVVVGLGADKPGIPGWHPDRIGEVREWLKARRGRAGHRASA